MAGVPSAEDFIHQTLIVNVRVTSSKSGTAKVLDHQTELGATEVRGKEFNQHPDGTTLEVHYKLNDGKKSIIFVRKIDAIIEEVEEYVSTTPQPQDEIPEWVGDHYLDLDMRKAFGISRRVINSGGIINMLMRGGSGAGKTSAYKAFADHNGMNCIFVDCATTLDPEQWFGFQEARDGDTVFIPTPFSEACNRGNTVIVLDEANRIEPWIANPLFAILDHRREIFVHGAHIKVAPRVLFGLTINEGPQYAGTHQLDKALMNRMSVFVHARPMERKIEAELLVRRSGLNFAECDTIVGLLASVRETVEHERLDIDVSTRSGLKIVELMKHGMNKKDAFEFVIVNSAQEDDVKPIIDVLKRAGF